MRALSLRSWPLRVRITAVVMASAALITLFVVVAGGVESVDEDIQANTLESTVDALDVTAGSLVEYVEGLERRLVDWSTGGEREADGSNVSGSFNDWALPQGVGVSVVDQDGFPALIEFAGPIEILDISICRVSGGDLSCEHESLEARGNARLGDLVEREANSAGAEGPAVVLGRGIRSAAGDYSILLTRDISSIESVTVTSGIEEFATVGLPLMVIALGLISWFALGRALRPVESIIEQVDSIGAESLDQRVPVPVADDELRHLATTMNRMLDRLQRSNDSQRRFISDASHELRSPITATRATLEVARADPEAADWEHVAAVVEQENLRLGSLVDDLLLLARLDEEAAPAQTTSVDLEEICLSEAERPHPVPVTVRVISPARVTGNLATLTHAIRNLIDNAASHAETLVQVEVDGSGSAEENEFGVVRVIDDGRGVPPELADHVFERFVRIDQSRSRDAGGAGLGLAIVRRVAQNHGGTAELEARPIGMKGASFVLRLPSSNLD